MCCLCIIITGSCANTISESDNIYLFIYFISQCRLSTVTSLDLYQTRLYYADGLNMYKNIDRHKFVGERSEDYIGYGWWSLGEERESERENMVWKM